MTWRKRMLLIPVVGAIGVLAFLLVRGTAERDVLLASGTVEGTEALVGFQQAGKVAAVHVREGEEVVQGQVLAVLDTAALHARRLQALSQAQSARSRLSEMEAGSRPQEVADARAAVEAVRLKLEDARRDLERTRILHEGGAVSREDYDKAITAVRVLEQEYRQAGERAELVARGPREEQIDAQRAEFARAEASVMEIEATIADAIVRAPFDGVVTVRHREPGEVVAPGAPAVTLLDRSDRWVRVYIPETRLAAVHLGLGARIVTDTYADRSYTGEVAYIASAAEFTPKSVQTAEERVKLVYSARVRITGDPTYDLKPGMPADLTLALARTEAPGDE